MSDPSPASLAAAVFPSHALEQIAARGITQEQARAVLTRPDAVLPVREGRIVAQAILPRPGTKTGDGPYLLRVFVDIDRDPARVVTSYWTSRVEKYRSKA